MANKKIEGLETEFKEFRTEPMIGYAMQQEIKAMQEETTKRFDNVMKALATLTAKIQPGNENKNIGPQYDDLGLLMNTQNFEWEQFLGITQDGTARDYVVLFERLTYQLVGVPEPVLEGTFISGLKPELRAYVRVMQRASPCHEAVNFY
ncbi:hypothetical protein Tco_0825234 [Tanacetum coccineum]